MNDLTPNRQNFESTPRRGQTRPYLAFPRATQDNRNHNHDETPRPCMIDQIYEQSQQYFEERGIYGTNIMIHKTQLLMIQFIEQFSLSSEEQGEQIEHIYKNKLSDIDLNLTDQDNLLFQINGSHIKQFDVELFQQLIYFPAQIITLFDQVLKHLYQKYYIDPEKNQKSKQEKMIKKQRLMVSIVSLNNLMMMRLLSEDHINKLVSFRGIVIRCSDIYPEMKTATFRCVNSRCKVEVLINLQNAKVHQPRKCPNCHSNSSYQLIHNHCIFTDKQYIKIQQLPENVYEGQTPSSVNIVCYDSNVNGMRPGDRVQIVGIYRCQPRKVNRHKLAVQTIFITYTDLISYQVIQQNRFKASLADHQTYFTQDEKDEFQKFSENQNIIDKLVESFAPSIYSHQTIKKGLLTQIFGGTEKKFQGRGRFRSDINICLVGDPSTAKSQLLKQVYQIAPRGIYTSGKSSSAVGLTANVRKDPETREFILESGALVLSDLGICCIDEFDKMDENSKLVLLEAMQQQTISVAKAGIVCQLNSRTSILSAANPINSKYDPKQSVVENINLPPALLSRFDLIYIILDIPNKKLDEKLAKHILNIFSGKSSKENQNKEIIPHKKFTKYITYARQYVKPQITKQAGEYLVQFYKEMRRKGTNAKTVSATVRQLQSLIRISEAFAKMRLSNEVTKNQVIMAYELIQQALKQSAIDPTTGKIDMDLIMTGHSSASRKRVDDIIQILKNTFLANPSDYLKKKVSFDEIFAELTNRYSKEDSINIKPRQQDLIEALNRLQKQGIINLFGNDKRYRPIVQYINPNKQ